MILGTFNAVLVVKMTPEDGETVFKGEVQSRITISSKKRIKISLQIGAKMMKIG